MLPYSFYKIVHILGIALARLNFPHGQGFPGWLWVKLGVWLAVAGIVMLPYRKPDAARPMLLALPLLAVTAALMAVYKPF